MRETTLHKGLSSMGEQRENENKNNTTIILLKQIIPFQMGNPNRRKLLIFEDKSICGLIRDG
jgi:hypothetical protein